MHVALEVPTIGTYTSIYMHLRIDCLFDFFTANTYDYTDLVVKCPKSFGGALKFMNPKLIKFKEDHFRVQPYIMV